MKKKRLSSDLKLIQENLTQKMDQPSSRRSAQSPENKKKNDEIIALKKEIRRLQQELSLDTDSGLHSDSSDDDSDFVGDQLSLKFLEVMDDGPIKKVSPATLR